MEVGNIIPLIKGKDSDEYWAEWDLVKQFEKRFGLKFELDVASNKLNQKAEWRLDKQFNALYQEWWYGYKNSKFKNGRPCVEFHWFQDSDGKIIGCDVWCNPPLSQTKEFTLKALEQWKKHNINILMLIPTGVISRKYFRDIWYKYVVPKNGIEVHPIDRPKFLHHGKKSKWSARNDYIALLFRRN